MLACTLASQPVPSALFVRAGQSALRASPRLAACHLPQGAAATESTIRSSPQEGDIGNPARTESGHFWWASARAHVVCIGTVRMWGHYRKRGYANRLVGAYEQHYLREFIGDQNGTLGPG